MAHPRRYVLFCALGALLSLITLAPALYAANSESASFEATDEAVGSVPGGERCTATVTVMSYNDKAVAGEPYRILWRRGGEDWVRIQEGTIPDNGVIRFAGDVLRGNVTLGVRVSKWDLEIGRLRFSASERHIDAAMETIPGPGDPAPEVRAEDLFRGTAVNLSDYRGKIVYVEFWASWCGWCQEPMAKLNAIALSPPEHWKDSVALLGISFDDQRQALESHVKSRRWTAVNQLWVPDETSRHQDEAYVAWGIPYVPTAALIDADGKIRWRGYAGYANPEQYINRLLEGAEPLEDVAKSRY